MAGSQILLKLPIIDFSKLSRNSNVSAWNLVRSQVVEALEEYGCFEAIFDKVSQENRKAVLDASKEFFDLPLQTKSRCVSEKPHHHYSRGFATGNVPLPESISIDDADVVEKVESITSILWPQGNPNFSKAILSFSDKVSQLDQIVRRMIIESLDLEKHTDEHMNSTYYLLRCMKYEGLQSTHHSKLGLDSHTDKQMVTILYQNKVDGLQIQTKDGGSWINVKPTPLSFIVMIGDSLHAWTNGRLHSPYHRVVLSGNEERYSIGLFSIPKEGYIIKAPEELIDEEHPLLFKPFDHIKFIEFFFSEAGRKAQPTPLKAYCGV